MEIKPDVLAPGVDVLSLAPGGGTAVMSGTSMSSPMVAGIAALLKSKRKGMTPAEVKSAIVNSSIDLGLSAMRQGGGRVDALRALGQRTAVEPAQLSFRLDDPAQSTWTQVETLLVVNSDGMAHDYSVAVAGNGAGYSVSTFPQAFSLAPGGTQSVLVTIGVNNLAVPIVNEDIRLYDGALLIMGTADTLRVPWAFARASRFLLAFSDTDPLFVGYTLGYAITPFNRVLDSKVRWIDPQHMEVIGAFDGTYNFAVYFPNAGKLVTREQIDFHGSGSIAFDASEATHTLRFDGRDENGQPFPPTADTRRTLRVDLPFEVPLFVALPAGSSTIMVSTSSTGIHFQPVESYIDLAGARRAVLPQYSSFQGISNDRILLPSAGTYTKQTVRFRVPPGTAQAKIYSEVITIQTIDSADYYNSIQVAIDTMDVGTGEASITLAEMKRIDTTFTTGIAFYVNAGDLSSDFLDYSTRYFTVPGDSLLVGLPSQQSLTSYRSPDGGTLTFGGGPVHIIDLSFNNGLANSIIFRLVFRGNLSEDRYTDVNHGTYAIFNEAGEELAEAPLDAPRAPFAVVPGKFRIEIQSENFYVSNAKGTVSLVNSVDLTKAVPDAPTVMSFMVRDGQGRAGDRVLVGDHATLRFSANGFSFGQQLPVADSTRVFYRKHRSLEWITLPVSLLGSEPAGVGSVFQADLAPATAKDSSGIDLRIRLVDQTGNAADMVVSPAFQVGQWVDQGPSGVEADGDIPATYALAQNFPNPFNPSTTVRYDLPVASEVTLAVYDVLGREISKLVNEVRPAGRHVVVFDGTKFASGAYFYRLQARPAQEAGARPARSAGAGSFVETRRFVLLK
jgi:subtilisin family serine protease